MRTIVLALCLLMLHVPASLDAAATAPEKPNILIILSDDLGYADLGFQGSKEVPTPHLDAREVRRALHERLCHACVLLAYAGGVADRAVPAAVRARVQSRLRPARSHRGIAAAGTPAAAVFEGGRLSDRAGSASGTLARRRRTRPGVGGLIRPMDLLAEGTFTSTGGRTDGSTLCRSSGTASRSRSKTTSRRHLATRRRHLSAGTRAALVALSRVQLRRTVRTSQWPSASGVSRQSNLPGAENACGRSACWTTRSGP